jgi:hypothetical protein
MKSTGKRGVKRLISCLNIKLLIISLLIIFSVVGIKSVWAQDSTLSTPSYCCEKTTNGAYCINTGEENCDASFQKSPTSCESTSYCKLGTCYDSSEGVSVI